MRKVLSWLALAIAVLWVIHNPAQAAATVQNIVHALTTLASNL